MAQQSAVKMVLQFRNEVLKKPCQYTDMRRVIKKPFLLDRLEDRAQNLSSQVGDSLSHLYGDVGRWQCKEDDHFPKIAHDGHGHVELLLVLSADEYPGVHVLQFVL